MSDLLNEAKTPAIIENEKLRFRIPLYQRPYAWEGQQVLQLLEDLYAAYTDDPNQDYHIGILSVAKARDGVYDLIDGQQRITTLALIGKAAGKYWLTERLDFYGRSDDKAYLTGMSEVACNPNPRMVQTVHIAEAYLRDHPTGLDDFICHHAAFFLSEVPAEYTMLDKNQQFVRFNNRGRQLEKHEILKVQIIKNVKDDEWQKTAFDKWNEMTTQISGVIASGSTQIENKLVDILQNKGSEEEEKSEESLYRAILGVEEFLLIALARKVGAAAVAEYGPKFYNKSQLLQTFKTYIKDDAARIGFIDVLQKQVGYLQNYFIFISKGNEKYVIGISVDDKDTVWLGDEVGDDGKKSLERQLIDTQSFLYVSTALHKWLVPAFDWICRQPPGGISAGALVAELERIDREDCGRLPLPTLEAMSFGNISHYWFYRLDYELMKLWRNDKPGEVWKSIMDSGDDVVKRLVDEFRFRHCGSVEHIVPQRFDGSDAFYNLALISVSSNSAFNSHGREQKMKMILERNRGVESLKMLHFLWSSQSPEEHGKTMYRILENAVNQQKI